MSRQFLYCLKRERDISIKAMSSGGKRHSCVYARLSEVSKTACKTLSIAYDIFVLIF